MSRTPSLIFLICCVAATASAQVNSAEDLNQRVIWNPHYPEAAYFVPEALLQRLPVAELPIEDNHRQRLKSELSRVLRLEEKDCPSGVADCKPAPSFEERVQREMEELEWDSEEQREGLRRMVERSVRSVEQWKATHPGPCRYASPAGLFEPEPEPFEFSKHLEAFPGVFLGRVVETVVGWSVRAGRVHTLVYLEVEEIFRDEHVNLWPGKLVAYEQASGEIRLRGARLCTVPEPGTTLVDSGDRVLAFDVNYRADHVWSDLPRVYPVRNGEILPQPLVPDGGIEPVPLAEFRKLSEAAEGSEDER